MSSGVTEPVESELDAQIAECSRAISRNPKDAKAYRQRGLLKARMHRYDDAIQDFDDALRLSPNDANSFGLRALTWAKIGNRPRAIADFDDAIRLAPPQNVEMLRTHRQRVLFEIPRKPIEGGDFNILKNPFVVLNLPPNAKPTTIKEAYEDAVEDGADDADVLMRAQQTLLTPRLRTEPEVGGFMAPGYMIRDRDRVYGTVVTRRLRAMGIRDKPIAPASPWQNGFAERLIGSIRRECLDHIIVLGEVHLRRILKSYARYYNETRTHLALDKDAPLSRTVKRAGRILCRPILGGLHHEYVRI